MTNQKPAALLAVTLLICAMCASLQAATITVNSLADTTADDGECTLREAIDAANGNTASGATGGECAAGVGSDTIEFSVAGTIQPLSQLPIITTVIHINGYTAPGAVKNTLPLAEGTNAQLKIEIDGTLSGNLAGLKLHTSGASGSIIEGLVINGGADSALCCAHIGIYMESVNGVATTIVRGNFIGTNIAGTERKPKDARGIFISPGANIVVGSDTGGAFDPGSVNLISGNDGTGVGLATVSNVRVRGNLIGTNAAGTAVLYNNQKGIWADDVVSGVFSDNVISGNSQEGFFLRHNSSDVLISGNIIGRNAMNTAAIPNNNGGILVAENPNTSPSSILDVDIVNNVVAGNLCSSGCGGINIGENNSVNTVKSIRLSGNRIFSNANLEIDLGVTNGTNNGLLYGVNANDTDDPDDGANTFQNFPELTSALGNGADVIIDFTLNSEPSKTFTVEFFHTNTCDASGYGGAELFLGGDDFATDASGDLADQITLPLTTKTGFITATATNVDNGTSEFSQCVAVTEDVDFKDSFENLPP